MAEIPGGTLYYQSHGTGPTLILSCGGPGNADTLGSLAASLQDSYTVLTYDRRGYSRSHLDHPGEKASISTHSDDLRLLISHVGTGPVSVFGTSFGALIALELAATAPAAIDTLIVHEPPLGQLLPSAERQPFDLNPGPQADASSALNAIAASIGVTRGPTGGAPGARPADIELFIQRDVPAIGDYHLDLYRLRTMAGRITVTGSEEGRDFYPYQCALRLADCLGTSLVELPGNHAGMIKHPAQFAARLRGLLPPRPEGAALHLRSASDPQGQQASPKR